MYDIGSKEAAARECDRLIDDLRKKKHHGGNGNIPPHPMRKRRNDNGPHRSSSGFLIIMAICSCLMFLLHYNDFLHEKGRGCSWVGPDTTFLVYTWKSTKMYIANENILTNCVAGAR